jgi:protein arginine N-methyltransferase 1
MYSIEAYGAMLVDGPRINAYVAALRQMVRPAATVVDIGTGTGIMAIIACQLGAARVIAVEPDSAIEVAREIAANTEFADRIMFLQEMSTHITLNPPADVIVSDLRGALPLYQQHINSLVDARTRLLAPGGVLIPQRDTIRVAVVHAPEQYQRLTQPWDNNPFGLNMQPARRMVLNTLGRLREFPVQILCPAQNWITLDYMTVTSPDVRGTVTWTVEHAGVAHGMVMWFDTELIPGIGFSNAPDKPELIYGRTFFPFEQPIDLASGDTVTIILRADLVDANYVWRWNTQVVSGQPAGHARVNLRQSTFFGAPVSLDSLRKRSATYVPTRNQHADADHLILDLMDGNCTLDVIAEAVVSRFPDQFLTRQAALAHVATLSEKYSR